MKVSNGFYQKIIADTLTKHQLKKLAEEITELKGRKPITITNTVIKPVYMDKPSDIVIVRNDSISITDYYPNKENPFLKYSNKTSLKTKKGRSTFDWKPIKLSQVTTKKDNGLYQVDFKGPDFLEVESLDIQTEPMAEPIKDNRGTLIGIEYGKNLGIEENIFEINVYQRYKKFYLGGAVSTDKDLKAGIKFEF